MPKARNALRFEWVAAQRASGGFQKALNAPRQRAELRFRNLQILPHYQQLTLVEAHQIRVSAPVFVRAAAES